MAYILAYVIIFLYLCSVFSPKQVFTPLPAETVLPD